jgi:hypothetical protein
MAKVILDSKEFIVTRSKFKTWIELEEIREKIFHAIEIEDTDDIGTHILFYVSTALSIDASTINNLPWKEVLSAYSIIVAENLNIRLLPFMKYSKKKLDDEREIWDYPGRLWYSYSHKIANEYGWKLSDISELEVDDAFSLVQEILTSEQLNKEWEWTLSDKSVGYDEASKKSRFIELPRPDWMKPIPKPPQKVKMPRVMMPQGNILKLTTDGRLENVVY